MDAIITDIHGNLEALQAVLEQTRRLGVTRVFCLGDLVCYGADSIECVRQSNDWDIVIAGDWDTAMIHHAPSQWNPTINQHIAYIRSEFRHASDSKHLIETIKSFKASHIESGIHFVHGTPLSAREWIFPEDIYNPKKLNRIAETFETVCVGGHAHLNGWFTRNDDSNWEFKQPVPGRPYNIRTANRTIVTVGSVGQPRDADPRASFLIRDGDFATFHRIEYDIETAAKKIRSNPAIDNMYAERLHHGR